MMKYFVQKSSILVLSKLFFALLSPFILFLQRVRQRIHINIEWILHQYLNRSILGGIWETVHEFRIRAFQTFFCSLDRAILRRVSFWGNSSLWWGNNERVHFFLYEICDCIVVGSGVWFPSFGLKLRSLIASQNHLHSTSRPKLKCVDCESPRNSFSGPGENF